MNDNDLIDEVSPLTSEFEGFREKPYRDSRGFLTVGFGTNLDNPGSAKLAERVGLDLNRIRKSGLTKTEAQTLLNAGLKIAVSDARKFAPNFDTLPRDAQHVLVDMSYNLGGPTLGEFKKLRAALARNDFDSAAREMTDSLWFNQTGNRSRALVARMKALAQRSRS
jgi:lysozyme